MSFPDRSRAQRSCVGRKNKALKSRCGLTAENEVEVARNEVGERGRKLTPEGLVVTVGGFVLIQKTRENHRRVLGQRIT